MTKARLWTKPKGQGRTGFVERIRYISTPSDHLMLVLLIAIAASGLLMQFAVDTDVIAVKGFFLGLMQFGVHSLPSDFILYLHLLMVAVLLLIFPISKLFHAPGIFFSPTRNQVDNPRERRHVAPWAAALDRDKA